MLEPYGLGTGIMPTGGGWRYEQTLPDGSVQRIPASGCAGNDGSLVRQVMDFRINAGIDLGNVELDVAEYIMRESPQNNRFPKRGAVVPKQLRAKMTKPGHRPYIERIREWLQRIALARPRLLMEDDADVRAEVCMKCPQNVPWKTACAPCVAAVQSRAMNVRQRPSYKHDKQLGACRLHDFHNSTAVFIDREDLPATHPEAPEFCWMHKVA